MNHQIAKTPIAPELRLLANGSSGCWDIDLAESSEGEWVIELNGPQAYLVFQMRDAEVISRAIRLLEATLRVTPPSEATKWNEERDSLVLGRFGSTTVSLVRDNEKAPRCFLTIGRPPSRSTLHLNLGAADIESLAAALRQVEEDIGNELPDKATA